MAITPAVAGPLVLEEIARLTSPDPTYTLNGPVSVDIDSIVATATKVIDLQDGHGPRQFQTAFLFRRQAGTNTWNYESRLVEEENDDSFPINISVAMDDGIIAINLRTMGGNSLRIFRRDLTGTAWIPTTANVGTVESEDLEISSGYLVAGSGTCTWDFDVFQRSSPNNWNSDWIQRGTATGPMRGCDDEYRGGDVDVSSFNVITGNPYNYDYPPQIRFYNVDGPPFYTQGVFEHPDGQGHPFGESVAMYGSSAAASGGPTDGLFLYRLTPGGWDFDRRYRPVDTYVAGTKSYLEMDNVGLVQFRQQPRGAVGVFLPQPNGEYVYGAKLVPSVGSLTNKSADIGGRLVVTNGVVNGIPAVYVFQLPEAGGWEQPALIQDDFQSGTATRWQPQAGSSFSVVAGTDSTVYRQQSLAGNASALLNQSDWRNQSIQAEIKPLEFQGADRWVGLVARYQDANNYYYVTLRNSNSLELKRMVNGVFQTLDTLFSYVEPNQTYRVRLEAIQDTLRVYVNEIPVLDARDTSLASGRTGLMMYRARADYDNVIVSPNPYSLLFTDGFNDSDHAGTAEHWTPSGIGNWNVVASDDIGNFSYRQTSTADGTRSITGVEGTGDQIIRLSALATGFGAGAGRWFGALARYQDDQNYYYVTLRNDNTVSLRKLVNGTIYVLDTAPFTLDTFRWYDIRLEAIGNSLRAYVDDRLLLEAQDSSFPTGKYGVVMYKAAAFFDDFVVTQP